MSHKVTISRKKISTICFAVFIVLLGLVFFLQYWWPGIMLVIGLPLALKQYLLGRKSDMSMTLFVFLGVFVTVQFQIPWKYLLPSLFTVGGLYLLFKELFFSEDLTEVEKEEEINEEIKDEKED